MRLLLAGLLVVTLSVGVSAMPRTLQNILIVELQTGSADSAGQEFIELYNPNGTEIVLTDWLLQYKSASSDTWRTKSVLTGTIEPRGRYLVASTNYMVDEAVDTFSSGLSKNGGHLRILEPATEEDGEDVVHDLLGWGTANAPEGSVAAVAPDAGESLKRIVDEDGYFIDTNVNGEDFAISTQPTPATDDKPTEVVEDDDDGLPTDSESEDTDNNTDNSNDSETEVTDGGADNVDTELDGDEVASPDDSPAPQTYKKINITELYVDPVSPQTDADDEFIELYNPNKTTVELKNYVLQTGDTYSHSFIIPELAIKPGQYLALYSIDTGLPLSNSGSRARLLDPNGDIVFETNEYDKARAGNSWVSTTNGKWQWSSEQTPGAPNVVIVPISASRRRSTARKVSARRKTARSRRKKGRKSRRTKTSRSDRIIYQEPASLENTELNMAVLVGVGVMAVGYGVYEYRRDITNRVQQFRKYLRTRR